VLLCSHLKIPTNPNKNIKYYCWFFFHLKFWKEFRTPPPTHLKYKKFGKRKYNRGKRVEGSWILGMIEIDTASEVNFRLEICTDNIQMFNLNCFFCLSRLKDLDVKDTMLARSIDLIKR
jgi:hypothetical protein